MVSKINSDLQITFAMAGRELDLVDGNVSPVLKVRQIRQRLKDESVRIGGAVGDVTLAPSASGRVGREPHLVHHFLPARLIDGHDGPVRSPRRWKRAFRQLHPRLGRNRGQQNAVDDERSRSERSRHLAVQRHELDAQKFQFRSAGALDVVLQNWITD